MSVAAAVDVGSPEAEQPGHLVQVAALRWGHDAIFERDPSQARQVGPVQVLDVDAGELERPRRGDEGVGLGGRDMPVKERLVEQVQVGVGLRLVQPWQPVDQPGQEVLIPLASGTSLNADHRVWQAVAMRARRPPLLRLPTGVGGLPAVVR